MRDAYPFGLFAVPRKDVVRVHCSSGTTGTATVVGYTQKDLENWGDCFARALYGAGCGPDSTLQIAYGYGLFTGGLGAHNGGERAGCTVLPMSTGNTRTHYFRKSVDIVNLNTHFLLDLSARRL